MLKLSRVFGFALIMMGATMLFEQAAYGYTDPETGLLAVQAAGAAPVAAGWCLRRKIYALLHRSISDKTEPPAQANNEQDATRP